MGAVMIQLIVPTSIDESPKDRHRKLMRYLNNRRKEDNAMNGHRDGYSGDWQTIHGVDDKRLKYEETITPEEAEKHADVSVEKRESTAYLVIHPKRGLEIHLWGLAAE
jgi:hypothetical protein